VACFFNNDFYVKIVWIGVFDFVGFFLLIIIRDVDQIGKGSNYFFRTYIYVLCRLDLIQ
jgi:hypothetical protein